MTEVVAPFAFAAGVLLAEFREGWIRAVGLGAMLLGQAAALTITAGDSASLWVAGPLVSIVVLAGKRAPRLSFERLMLRFSVTLVLVLAAGYFARRLPAGEMAWTIAAMPWVLASVGIAWVVVPRDRTEARRGAVVAIAGGSALLLFLFPPTAMGALISGLAAMVPLLVDRTAVVQARPRPWLSVGLGIVATALAALAVRGLRLPVSGVVALTTDGTALTGAALLVLSAAFSGEIAVAMAGLLSVASLWLTSPGPHWATLAAALAILPWEIPAGRLAWAGLVCLGLSPSLAVLIPGPLGGRWQAAALAMGWVLIALARGGRWTGAIALTAATLFSAESVSRLTTPSLGRFQWLAFAGALVVVLVAIMPPDLSARWHAQAPLRTALSRGLLLIAIATDLPIGLAGALLVLLDLGVVQASAPSGPPAAGFLGRIALLARSGWPGSCAFAGRVLILLAATAASPVLAAGAIVLVVGLQIAPRWDGAPPARAVPAPAVADWVAAAVSLAAGIGPSLVLRMVQGGS